MLATPVLLGKDRASRPPPLQHRVPIRACIELLSQTSPLALVLPDRSGTFSDQVRWLFGRERSRIISFQPHGSWTYVWATLGYLPQVVVADVARRRVSGLFATPDSFRLNQSPLGAIHLPQAPTTVAHTPSPKVPFDSSGGVVLSSALADSRSIPFALTESQAVYVGLVALLKVANAIATWRQA